MDDLTQALADRTNGVMPNEIKQRPDALPLWMAFRRHVGIVWSMQRQRDFAAGWDAALKTLERRARGLQ